MKNTKKKIEEDMVMSGPADSSGSPGTAFDVPQSVPGGMDTFSLLGPGKSTKKRKKKKSKKNKYKKGKGHIISFSDFFKKNKNKK